MASGETGGRVGGTFGKMAIGVSAEGADACYQLVALRGEMSNLSCEPSTQKVNRGCMCLVREFVPRC